MSFSGNNRLIKGASGRFALGVLLLAWVNIAAQPCLMAMELAPDSSFASEHTVHSEHSEHSAHASDAPDCGHCPTLSGDQAVPCETGSASECEIFPGYNVDGRQFKQLAKDVSPHLALFTLGGTLNNSTDVTPFLPHDVKRLKFNGDPPLNIRHCVFLK